MKSNHEIRRVSTRANKIEIRSARKAGTIGVVEGLAVVYSPSLSSDLGGFVETVSRGALSNLGDGSIQAYYQHNSEQLLATEKANTLRLTDTPKGLHFSIDVPDTTAGNDLLTLAKRGDLTDMSWGFVVKPGGDSWRELSDGRILRTLNDVHIFEISAVSQGAYPSAFLDVATRSCPAHLKSKIGRSVVPNNRRDLDEIMHRMKVLQSLD